MSLERKYRKGVRAIRKRDKDLAKKGTTAGAEQVKKTEAKAAEEVETQKRIARANAVNANLSARQAAATAPSIKSVGDDNIKTGDADLEVKNDNGFGTHIERPGNVCGEDGCKAAFHEKDTLATHKSLYHGPEDQLFG
jgi:uncharacterized protein (DUF849 family)